MKLPNCTTKWLKHFASPLTVYESSIFFISSPILSTVNFLHIFVVLWWCIILVSICVFILNWLLRLVFLCAYIGHLYNIFSGVFFFLFCPFLLGCFSFMMELWVFNRLHIHFQIMYYDTSYPVCILSSVFSLAVSFRK